VLELLNTFNLLGVILNQSRESQLQLLDAFLSEAVASLTIWRNCLSENIPELVVRLFLASDLTAGK